MKNQLRIIGGEWKRRQLAFASIEGLRPTPDRVRETLFNWLMWDVQNAKVLDLCSGSGALAFEALSRGAAHVVMIEPNRTQAQFLQQNLELLRVNKSKAQLKVSTAQHALATIKDQFDLVFLDPPYAKEEIVKNITDLEEAGLLSEDVMIVCETDKSVDLPEEISNFGIWKQKTYGISKVTVYIR